MVVPIVVLVQKRLLYGEWEYGYIGEYVCVWVCVCVGVCVCGGGKHKQPSFHRE
jgi:hypothetical protein